MPLYPFTSTALADKVAFVTGADTSVGRACAVAYAKAGAKIALIGRRMEGLRETADDLELVRGESHILQVDMEDPRGIESAVKQTVARFSGLDLVVQTPTLPGSPAGSVTSLSLDEIDEYLGIEVRSATLLTRAVLPVLQMSEGGLILYMVGKDSTRPTASRAITAANEAAIVNLSRSIALDYAQDGIRSNVIGLGYVDTDDRFNSSVLREVVQREQPLPGAIQPAEVAALSVFLATDMARMITGQLIAVDGGLSIG